MERFKKVVKSPLLQFAVGIIMLFSSLAGQQGSLYSDLMSFKMGLHHGIHFAGLWNILQALPNLWDSATWLLSKWLDD